MKVWHISPASFGSDPGERKGHDKTLIPFKLFFCCFWLLGWFHFFSFFFSPNFLEFHVHLTAPFYPSLPSHAVSLFR